MTKTQIQVPEELFAEIKAFAQRREWSLAETFRRGVELLLEPIPKTLLRYPPRGSRRLPGASVGKASPPSSYANSPLKRRPASHPRARLLVDDVISKSIAFPASGDAVTSEAEHEALLRPDTRTPGYTPTKITRRAMEQQHLNRWPDADAQGT